MNRREFLLTTGAAAGAALLHPDLRPAEAARGANPMKGQPFVFNQDCNDVDNAASAAPQGKRQEFIRDWYRRAFAAGSTFARCRRARIDSRCSNTGTRPLSSHPPETRTLVASSTCASPMGCMCDK